MSSPSAQPDATIVIVTKNRVDELRNAVRSAFNQRGASTEVLVVDDGSSDGTSEMISREFPDAVLHRSEQSVGLVVQRNRAAELARGGILFSIDDDAVFSTPDIVAQTLADFDDPRIGAVAIPFINVRQDAVVRQTAPNRSQTFVTRSFIGTAHAVRRATFRQIGGYREYLVHQGEEGDFCIRLLDAGFVVRLGRADPIHHFESPRRDFRRMDLYGRRNDVLFAWHNVPMPYFPQKLLATTSGGLLFGMKARRARRMAHGLLLGWIAMGKYWRLRRPVSRRTYALYLKLREPIPLSEIDGLLASRSQVKTS